jgi:hypothetical protein
MTEKILVVTPPDDVLYDGLRILLVDLDIEQTKLISDALQMLNNDGTVMVYMWKNLDSIEWLFDRKLKSDLIIFNANSTNDLLVGYFSAQFNSYYIGTLRTLSLVNNSVIYNVDQLVDIFQKRLYNKLHGKNNS